MSSGIPEGMLFFKVRTYHGYQPIHGFTWFVILLSILCSNFPTKNECYYIILIFVMSNDTVVVYCGLIHNQSNL